ncbi:MAG: hypothetical protein MJ214_03060 [Bacilli bacterium]|nr:hypothetical protein [Bacilli bacterium]
MVFSNNDFRIYFRNISNINQKIRNEVNKNRFVRIVRGIYSSDPNNDYLYIANRINNNSYISFDYALYYYGLIPERVNAITSATRNTNKKRAFVGGMRKYIYRDVNSRAYSEDINCIVDVNNNNIRIASREKAICDKLSTIPHIRTMKGIKNTLFYDLRIDEEVLFNLNIDRMISLSKMYNKPTLNIFAKFLEKRRLYESGSR